MHKRCVWLRLIAEKHLLLGHITGSQYQKMKILEALVPQILV